MRPPEGSTILTRETSRPLRPYRGALPPYDRGFLASRHGLRHCGEHDVDPRAVFRNFPSDIRVFRYDEHCLSAYRLTATDISHIRLCPDHGLARQRGAPPARKALGGHRHSEQFWGRREYVRSSSSLPALRRTARFDIFAFARPVAVLVATACRATLTGQVRSSGRQSGAQGTARRCSSAWPHSGSGHVSQQVHSRLLLSCSRQWALGSLSEDIRRTHVTNVILYSHPVHSETQEQGVRARGDARPHDGRERADRGGRAVGGRLICGCIGAEAGVPVFAVKSTR